MRTKKLSNNALTYLEECHPLVAGVIAQISLYHQSPVEPVKLFVAFFTPENIQHYKDLVYTQHILYIKDNNICRTNTSVTANEVRNWPVHAVVHVRDLLVASLSRTSHVEEVLLAHQQHRSLHSEVVRLVFAAKRFLLHLLESLQGVVSSSSWEE